ncbi:MFS transporter [Streptomyces sp. DT2A-34]|uniref:MFS transporter n=1 Tax=Streptomyces sp. DT2A-34 TaxID=3051182 RepID=UPI00265C61D6|nr:MFS transporter [Streptomyces sp. DT2A-34]MDO0916655.1 MFS transporter [Streptomyces sp. DT2A-34]
MSTSKRSDGTGLPVRARRVTATVFAAQGAAVAAVTTTMPAVKEHLGLSPLLITALTVALALSAGVGSFAGLFMIRRVGPVAAMRVSTLLAAAVLLLIGWAPNQATAMVAYPLFGLAVGGIDVSVNTRAAAVERAYGRSIFASFYAAWSAVGVLAALLTAGTARLGWAVEHILTAHAVLVLILALTIRTHPVPSASAPPVEPDAPVSLGLKVWVRLAPFGIVLLIAYVIDSTVSTWSTVYLRDTLAASLAVAPLAFAAYQVGTVAGRACGDLLIRRFGPPTVIRGAALTTAVAMAGLAAAPTWHYAVVAAGCAGVGVAAFAPLCLASAGRLLPEAAESVLARMNTFNYLGVLIGGAVSGLLGSTGHFRLAYAVPACLALVLLVAARAFRAPASVPVPHAAETRMAPA